METEGF